MAIDAKRAIEMYVHGLSLAEVGEELGYTLQAIRYVLRKYGIALRPRGGNQTGITIDEDQALALYESGETMEAVARRFGVDSGRIRRLVLRRGRAELAEARSRRRAWIPAATLTAEQVAQATSARLVERATWDALGRRFGVASTTVRRAVIRHLNETREVV